MTVRAPSWTVDFASVAGVTAGGSATSPGADTKTASKYTLASGITIGHLEAYVDGAGAGSGDSKIRLGVYADSGGSPDTLVVSGDEITVKDGQAAGWVGSSVTHTSLSATTYWFAVISDNARFRVYYDTGSSGDQQSNGDTYNDGFASPFGASSSGSALLSIRGFTAASRVTPSATLAASPRPKAMQPRVVRVRRPVLWPMLPVFISVTTTPGRRPRAMQRRLVQVRPPIFYPVRVVRRLGRGAGW